MLPAPAASAHSAAAAAADVLQLGGALRSGPAAAAMPPPTGPQQVAAPRLTRELPHAASRTLAATLGRTHQVSLLLALCGGCSWRRWRRRQAPHGGSRSICCFAAAGRAAIDGAVEDVSRRAVAAIAGIAATAGVVDTVLRSINDRYAALGTIIPPAPFRETVRTELVPGRIWGFEQCIALLSVSTNIRMTVVKLRDGSLWISSPVSPTRECLRLLNELGKVAHIVVPSSALEHKASVQQFASRFPGATLWVTPGQEESLIKVPAGSRVLGEGVQPPWADELDCKIFFVGPPITDVFSEAAFFHRETKTLLVTDCALKLPATAPKVLESYGYDGTPGPISLEQWRYKAIAFSFVSARGKDEADFKALQSPVTYVNPLIRFLVYRRCPDQAKAWVQDVAKWPFVRVVPCHLAAPYDCNPKQFLEAFGFLFGKKSSWEPEDEQLAFLRFLREQVGGPAF